MPGLCLLLLPAALDSLADDHTARDLHRADGVVAVEPARVSDGALARLPAGVGDVLAGLQARRLLRALPAEPAVVAAFAATSYPLARGLLAATPGCELQYAPATPPATERLRELDLQARGRSALTFDPAAPADELWERLRQLGVDIRVSARAMSRRGP